MTDIGSAVELELSTKCTISCVLCPRTLLKDTRQSWDHGYMDIDIVKRAIADQNFNRYLLVGCYGDAIYHPAFYDICQMLIQSGKRVFIETNGAHRSKNWWNDISMLPWDRELHTWCFSIDGLRDTNHIHRRNSNWDSIITGINILSNSTNKPTMVWKYIVFPYNRHQVSDAKNLSESLGFDHFKPVESLRDYRFLSESDRMLYDMEFYREATSKMPEQRV